MNKIAMIRWPDSSTFSFKRKLALILSSCVLTFLIAYCGWIKNLTIGLEKNTQQQQVLLHDLNLKNQQITQLLATRKERDPQQAIVDNWTMIKLLALLSRFEQIKFQSITPLTENTAPTSYFLPIEIELFGNYFSLVQFIQTISTAPYYLSFNQLILKQSTDGHLYLHLIVNLPKGA